MTLTLNTKYRDRHGNAWKVISVDPTFGYPFLAAKDKSGSVQSFTEDGRWSRYMETENDLIGEVL